jgi:hypothetical protein
MSMLSTKHSGFKENPPPSRHGHPCRLAGKKDNAIRGHRPPPSILPSLGDSRAAMHNRADEAGGTTRSSSGRARCQALHDGYVGMRNGKSKWSTGAVQGKSYRGRFAREKSSGRSSP